MQWPEGLDHPRGSRPVGCRVSWIGDVDPILVAVAVLYSPGPAVALLPSAVTVAVLLLPVVALAVLLSPRRWRCCYCR